MQNRSDMVGLGVKEYLQTQLKTYRKQLRMAAAAVAGYVMASSYIFGGVSPFGAAFCVALPSPYAMFAGLGAVVGYTVSAASHQNLKYLIAVALVLILRWVAGDRLPKRFSMAFAPAGAFVALAITGGIYTALSDATLYDLLLAVAEVFLGAGMAYFFARTLRATQAGWSGINRSDVSCVVVSFAVVIMGLAPITVAGLSLGRILSVLVVLFCARTGGEAGGSVSGITAGIAMGLSGGDYAYAISAYGFGGLMAGVFGSLGRIATTGAFILVNTVAAIFTKSSGEVLTSLFEIFVASVVFIAIPQSLLSRLRLSQINVFADNDTTAQGALRGRLEEISGALLDISATTREVGERLGKMEDTGIAALYNRVAERACYHCGMKTTCWQFRYTDTMNALNDAMAVLKRDGSINREHLPKHFVQTCCRLEDFLVELNTQFHDHVAKQGTQRKVSRVRSVLTEQFEGMAMMLDEISGEVCGVRPMEPAVTRKVREYFEGEGFSVEQVRCHTDAYDRITVEVAFPQYQLPKLKKEQSVLDLDDILDAELDLPHIALHRDGATASYTEKANFAVELGAYQIAPDGNKLCGDAYEIIRNRTGKAHFILSDGMGSGGGAAVDSHMAAGLLSQLISVGFGHESALKMVNSALLIKSGEETLATIDICSVDLYTGYVEFYKAGAAPTYVCRGGAAGYVESTSLPAGILRGVAFEKSGITLRESDLVLLVSDGVTATGTDWVKSELKTTSHSDMQRLAEHIAMTAKIRRTDGHEDDITVLAVALRKGA